MLFVVNGHKWSVKYAKIKYDRLIILRINGFHSALK